MVQLISFKSSRCSFTRKHNSSLDFRRLNNIGWSIIYCCHFVLYSSANSRDAKSFHYLPAPGFGTPIISFFLHRMFRSVCSLLNLGRLRDGVLTLRMLSMYGSANLKQRWHIVHLHIRDRAKGALTNFTYDF